MKRLLILGAGTAGTMMANKLHKALPADWSITVVDKDEVHYYQPGYLFVPFRIYDAERLVRPKRDFLPDDVEFVVAEVERVEPDERQVHLTDGRSLAYDVLVIATGTTPRPATSGSLSPGRTSVTR